MNAVLWVELLAAELSFIFCLRLAFNVYLAFDYVFAAIDVILPLAGFYDL